MQGYFPAFVLSTGIKLAWLDLICGMDANAWLNDYRLIYPVDEGMCLDVTHDRQRNQFVAAPDNKCV